MLVSLFLFLRLQVFICLVMSWCLKRVLDCLVHCLGVFDVLSAETSELELPVVIESALEVFGVIVVGKVYAYPIKHSQDARDDKSNPPENFVYLTLLPFSWRGLLVSLESCHRSCVIFVMDI